jgi:hypothetical protein
MEELEFVSDSREQKRTIEITFKLIGQQADLDEFIDFLLKDLEIILTQRPAPNGLRTKVVIK